MQLVGGPGDGRSSQMDFLVGTPAMTYFAGVVRQHSNFALQTIELGFNVVPSLATTLRQSFTCRLPRNGDLVHTLMLAVRLPDLYGDGLLRPRWVPRLAQAMLDRATLTLDGQVIDEVWGEQLAATSDMTLPAGKKEAYDRMTGNVREVYDPTQPMPTVVVQRNRLSYQFYRVGAPGAPTVSGRTLYLPLPFFCTKSFTHCLPLVALQYVFADVTVFLRPLEDLIQLWDPVAEEYVSPAEFRGRGFTGYTGFGQFLTPPGEAPAADFNGTLDLGGTLLASYVFLDTPERTRVAAAPQELIIERTQRVEYLRIDPATNIDLKINGPIKELVFLARRSDAPARNAWSDFSSGDGSGKDLLSTATMLWNGMTRQDELPVDYYNLVEPFLRHSNAAATGVYVMPYALKPESPVQPSGAFNASTIAQIQLRVTRAADVFLPEGVGVDLIVFAIGWNVFRMQNGHGGMVFAQ